MRSPAAPRAGQGTDMLYLLYEWLKDTEAGRWLNFLRYPTFRIVAAGAASLVIGIVVGPRLIGWLRFRQHGISNVREDTPDTHQKKKGTPTLGGALILLSIFAGTLLFADLRSRVVLVALLCYVAGTGVAIADVINGQLVGVPLHQYLGIAKVEGGAELAVFCAAIVGAGIAFLWFNSYPASVFMGDVGSLALGGALGTLA